MLTLNKNRIAKTMFLLCLISGVFAYSQDSKFSRNSIKTGLGFGYNAGIKEQALGTICSIGYERSFGKKERLRLNAGLLLGEFIYNRRSTYSNFYRTTSCNININYDFVKYKAVSIFIYTGGLANISRGMLGSDFDEVTLETYGPTLFDKGYLGINSGLGLRINPPSNRCAFEVKPVNFQTGSRGFFTFYMMFGVDIKFKN